MGVLEVMEDNMLSRLVSGSLLGALAGAAMLVVASGPSSAFTLSSPSLERGQPASGNFRDALGRRFVGTAFFSSRAFSLTTR